MEKKNKRFGPRELPLLGSGMQFGKNPLQFLSQLHADYGEVAQYHLLGGLFVAPFSPRLIDQVLIKNANNYVKSVFVRERWKPFFGRGVLTAESDEWKNSRKALQPFMSRDKLVRYFEVMLSEFEKYGSSLKEGTTVNISRDMMELMFVSLVKILFHSDLDEKKIKRFEHLFDECVKYFSYTLQPAGILFHKLPTPAKKRFHKAIAELDGLIAEMLKMDTDPSDVNMFSALKQARDENGNPLSDELIRDNVLSFFMAGHETSSLSICYALFLLATNPVEMKKLQQELDEVLKGRSPTFADLEQLHVTKNVINEAMRLYPPVGFMGREAIGDDELGGIKIKKGTNIIIPIFALHRSPENFENPLAFRPERWETYDFSAKRHDFIPFGIGPRVCMGASFAMMEIVTVLAILLQKFDFELESSPELKLVSSITMRPQDDILLKVKRR